MALFELSGTRGSGDRNLLLCTCPQMTMKTLLVLFGVTHIFWQVGIFANAKSVNNVVGLSMSL